MNEIENSQVNPAAKYFKKNIGAQHFPFCLSFGWNVSHLKHHLLLIIFSEGFHKKMGGGV